MYRRDFVSALLGLLIIGGICGCGGGDSAGRQAISGTVTLDGQALPQGSISFQPMDQGGASAGAVITGGSYSVPQEQGLPPGKYRVVINSGGGDAVVAPGGMPGDEPAAEAQELVPPEWNTKSDKTIDVTEGGSTKFDFDIKSS